MNITILNHKGGQGKSIIAHQLITNFGYYGYEIDPYGSLAQRLPEKVTYIDLAAKKIDNMRNKVIFDFGGFADIKEKEAIKESDLVIVPFIPVYESVQGTYATLEKIIPYLIEYDVPLLFVPNNVAKEKDMIEALNLFKDDFQMEVDYYPIPYLVGLQTAINENTAIGKLAANGGFKGMPYKKSFDVIKGLHDKILEYDPKDL